MKEKTKDCVKRAEQRETFLNKICIITCIYSVAAVLVGVVWTLIDLKTTHSLGFGIWLLLSGVLVRVFMIVGLPLIVAGFVCGCKIKELFCRWRN